MATGYSTELTTIIGPSYGLAPAIRVKANKQTGALRIFEASYTVPASGGPAVGEKIVWGKLPPKARILGNLSRLRWSAGAASSTLNLGDIVRAQDGGIGNWFFVWLFPLFIVYVIAGVAETNRAPFDVAEGESEIVAGFHVEYSGIAFALFFLAEYANMILISGLTAVFFVGGWLSPFEGLFGADSLLGRPSFAWLFIKLFFFLSCFLWYRATFPRYRYDQIMRLGWKVLIPVTLVWLAVEGVLVQLKWGPWKG